MQGTMMRMRHAPASLQIRLAVHHKQFSSNSRINVQQQQTAVQAVASEVSTSSSLGAWPQGCEIRMLYDGECSLCMKEVNFLRKRDASKGKIDFVDVASPSYKAEDNAGITFEQAMERIHAILPDGTIVKDIEVFRRLYEAVDLGWVYAITKYKAVEDAGNAVYNVWAKYRTQLTGREALDVILARHRAEAAGKTGSLCRDDQGNVAACELPGKQLQQ